MNFVSDPLSLALALGLLGPAAIDEQGIFDEGVRDDEGARGELVNALAAALDVPLNPEGDRVILDEELTVDLVFED